MNGKRSRLLAAVSVVALVFVTTSGVPTVAGLPSADSTSFVPITPCRLMDTRAGSIPGPRHTPLNPGETYDPAVWGSNGDCVIPENASAISMNVTFVNPTANGFVTVFPPDEALPNSSNLNFVAGGKPRPNNVTSPLSADGRIGFANSSTGTVNLIADIVGYYTAIGAPDGDVVIGACSAQLRWDLANCKRDTFATGGGPRSLTFDGIDLWVVNNTDETVSRIDPVRGDKTDFAVGGNPTELAFDGTSIWVTNRADDTVSKINRETGVETVFATGDEPTGIAFDGTSLWVLNHADNTASKINPATGTKTDYSIGDGPKNIAFDGSHLWVSNSDDTLSKIDPSNGTIVLSPSSFLDPRGMAFDGTNLWVANWGDATISKVNPVTGVHFEYLVQSGPTTVAFDGTSIWVVESLDGNVTKVNPTTAERRGYGVGNAPHGVAFDGTNIWVTNSDDDTVSRLVAGRGVLTSNLVGPSNATAFVPITPCRLMDTRFGSMPGPRHTPLTAGETYAPQVWGSNGDCVVPATATAVSMNVTVLSPTSNGFITVFPPDAALPNTSNLNFVAAQGATPNGVTSPLSADGKVAFKNSSAGTVNLIADVVGYYEVTGSAPGDLVMGNCYALLRWDLPGCRADTFATGNFPSAIAFDGTSIWIANTTDSTVSKMNPATGAAVTYPTGTHPSAVMFDGTSVWVANTDADTVSKIEPVTGDRTDYPTGQGPIGLAFDGSHVWVTLQGDNEVSKIDPDTGAILASYATGDVPWGIAFDGTSLWIANYNSHNVSKMNPGTGTKTDYSVGTNPTGVAFDGTRIWVTNLLGNSVSTVNPFNGATTDFVMGTGPAGVAFDGTNIWVANSGSDTVSRVNIFNGTRTDYPAGDGATGVAFDGGNIWVTNSLAATVTKLVPTATAMRLSGVAAEGSSSFVPITPCRLMDTRSASQVGPRGTKLNPSETYAPTVWGTNGNCTIPATASAVSLNVTFTAPTAGGFVTVFPPDQPLPNSSSLNFTAGQAPAPNGVISPLSVDGKIGFFNAFGQVNLIVDIVGYYTPIDVVTTRCLPTLRWDLPACDPATYPTGGIPQGIAFDGTNLWIANNGPDTVSKMDPATGTKVDYPVGTDPFGVAFDGRHIWVTNSSAATVSKIDPATGAEIAAYSTGVGSGPRGITFDGTSLWIASPGAGEVARMNPVDGTLTQHATGAGAWDVAYDGRYIFVVNRDADSVSKLEPATGVELQEYPTGDMPIGIGFDGTNLWIANVGADTVSKMNPITGSKVDIAVGDGPTAFAFDGVNMWVTNQNVPSITRINVTTGELTYFVTNTHIEAIVFDGENLWLPRYFANVVDKVVI